MTKRLIDISNLLVVCLVALSFVSCTKDLFSKEGLEHNSIGEERYVSLSAGMPTSSDKAYLSGYDVKWESTDQLKINGTSLPVDELNSDHTQATFRGNLSPYLVSGNEVYWAVYPHNMTFSAAFPHTSSTITLPATQDYYSNHDPLSGGTFMVGYASVAPGTGRINIQMRNTGAVLKLHLTGSATNNQVSKIVLSTTSGYLAGSFTCTPTNNNQDMTVTASSASRELTVNLHSASNNYIDISGGGADIYVIVPPLANNDLTVAVYNTDGCCFKKTTTNTTLLRTHLYTNSTAISCFNVIPPYFSLSESTKVVFAPGNLQYDLPNGPWSIVNEHWDRVGGLNGTRISNNSDCIDLLGWGTSGYDNTANDPQASRFHPSNYATSGVPNNANNTFGYGPSTTMSSPDLTGNSAHYDWGVHNAIENHGVTDPAGTWRVMSWPESSYLFSERSTTSGIRFVKAKVHTRFGVILVPDKWCDCIYHLNNANQANVPYTSNTITREDWLNILKPAGCVFLVAAGERKGTTVYDVDEVGHYWLSTHGDQSCAYSIEFSASNVYPTGNGASTNQRCWGRSVRLVKPYTGN